MDNKHGLTKEEAKNFDSFVIRFIQGAIKTEKEDGLEASIGVLEMAHKEMAKSLMEGKPSISHEDATVYTEERFAEISKQLAAGVKINMTNNTTGETHTESAVKTKINYTRVIITLAIIVAVIYYLAK